MLIENLIRYFFQNRKFTYRSSSLLTTTLKKIPKNDNAFHVILIGLLFLFEIDFHYSFPHLLFQLIFITLQNFWLLQNNYYVTSHFLFFDNSNMQFLNWCIWCSWPKKGRHDFQSNGYFNFWSTVMHAIVYDYLFTKI